MNQNLVDISKFAPPPEKFVEEKVVKKKILQTSVESDKQDSPYILRMDPEIRKELKR